MIEIKNKIYYYFDCLITNIQIFFHPQNERICCIAAEIFQNNYNYFQNNPNDTKSLAVWKSVIHTINMIKADEFAANPQKFYRLLKSKCAFFGLKSLIITQEDKEKANKKKYLGVSYEVLEKLQNLKLNIEVSDGEKNAFSQKITNFKNSASYNEHKKYLEKNKVIKDKLHKVAQNLKTELSKKDSITGEEALKILTDFIRNIRIHVDYRVGEDLSEHIIEAILVSEAPKLLKIFSEDFIKIFLQTQAIFPDGPDCEVAHMNMVHFLGSLDHLNFLSAKELYKKYPYLKG